MRAETARTAQLSSASRARIAEQFRSGRGPLGDARQRLGDLVRAEAPLVDSSTQAALTDELLNELVGLGALERLLADEEVTDILVDGPGTVRVERNGRLELTTITLGPEEVDTAVQRLVTPLGLRADRSHPIVDARRGDGTRVAVVMPPVAPDGPLLALRRHSNRGFDLGAYGAPAVVALLDSALRRRLNVVVYGATGAGKTSLLTSLCSRLPAHERVVLVEDTAELRPVGPALVRLEARVGTVDGAGRTGMGSLVRAALRLRPDRIVVGEVRGAEAADMIWALSTGHRGSMSTLHADGPADALARLEVMVVMGLGESVPLRAARSQVRSAVDLLVGVARDPDGTRRVLRIDACGQHRLEPIFLHRGDPDPGGAL